MECEYEESLLDDKERTPCCKFTVKTRKGTAHGVFSKNKIWVHGIFGEGSVKGLMGILTKKFNCYDIVFTPLINNNVENSIRGNIKICKADDPANHYGEDFKYMECKWSKL